MFTTPRKIPGTLFRYKNIYRGIDGRKEERMERRREGGGRREVRK